MVEEGWENPKLGDDAGRSPRGIAAARRMDRGLNTKIVSSLQPTLTHMPARTIAIGDIHGCLAALDGLLDQIELTGDDTLVVMGDMIDRGPDSAGVIERLVGLVADCRLVPLVGNHERMMLDAIRQRSSERFWLQNGGQATLASYGGSASRIPPHHRMFFQHCQLYYETARHFFIHANYHPYFELPDQPQDIALWQHIDATFPPPHQSGKTAVVGHTPQTDGLPRNGGHIVMLDTFCYGGQWLTAWDVDSDVLWQANNSGQVRTTPLPPEINEP